MLDLALFDDLHSAHELTGWLGAAGRRDDGRRGSGDGWPPVRDRCILTAELASNDLDRASRAAARLRTAARSYDDFAQIDLSGCRRKPRRGRKERNAHSDRAQG